MSTDELKEENGKLQKENEKLRNLIVELNLQLQEHKHEEAKVNIKPLSKIDENTKLNIAVFGGGSFGTALATIAARKGHNIIILVRDKQQAQSINESNINPKREWLKKYKLASNIKCTTDITDAVTENTDLIIHAIPTQFTPAYLEKYAKYIPKHIPLVCTAKGIHLKTEKLLSDIIPSVLGRTDPSQERVLYLSGPSFAKEMMENHPVAVVLASNNYKWCKYVQAALHSLYFRIYLSTDVIGVECGGALKNPLAIGAGIAVGLGYGQSTLAGIVTRGAVEIQKLALALGCKHPSTLYGLSGFGDLMLTSMCELSRNRTCGYYMGKEGLSVEDAQKKVGETVEGVTTALVAQKLMRKYGLRMPLFDALADVLQNKLSPDEALRVIMAKVPEQEGFVEIQDNK